MSSTTIIESPAGPPVRTGAVLQGMIGLFTFIAMGFSGWAATNLNGLKETSLRQEGTNALMSEKLNGLSDAVKGMNADRYYKREAEQDWAEQKRFNEATDRRVGALESRRR